MQEAPFAIQIEPSEGCSLACGFCALQSIRNNGADWKTGKHGVNSTPYKFMTLETSKRIADEIARVGWNPRIEFAMHGNPSSNKNLVEMIRIFRTALPKVNLMVTDNGSGFIKAQRILDIFEAGLNTLALDNYKHSDFVPRVLESYKAIRDETIPLYNYPKNKKGNPHQRLKHTERRIVIIEDISQLSSGTHKLTNQGGSAGLLDKSMANKRCAKPFRELAIRWDGNIALCCDDWPGIYKIGNINDKPLDKLWNHPRFGAARTKLYAGQRDFGPCKGCNVRSYRTGLLPDKLGKEVMPEPSKQTTKSLDKALAGEPYSPIVKKGKSWKSLFQLGGE